MQSFHSQSSSLRCADASSAGCACPVQRQSCRLTGRPSAGLAERWAGCGSARRCCRPPRTCWGFPGRSRSCCCRRWPGTSSAPGTLGSASTGRSQERERVNHLVNLRLSRGLKCELLILLTQLSNRSVLQ